uniref:Uncharacterized protein n=1 Tax=Geospiza parvula TaxID=87175 RepID=A0A8C3N8J6_GEOPR
MDCWFLVWKDKSAIPLPSPLQEWVASLVFLYILRDSAGLIMYYPSQEFPYKALGRLDEPAFNASGVTLMFTPATNSTRSIMAKVASSSSLRGKKLLNPRSCSASSAPDPSSWQGGTRAFMKTNHSVWKEMKSISGVHLQTVMKPLFKLDYLWFIICAILSYCPYMHFLSVKVLKEKKKLKILMRAMAEMHPANYWFSLPQIHFTFLLSSLLKQPNISSFVGFLLHILFGALGFLTLFEKLPRALEWILNLFSPFAFTAGLATLYPFYNLYLILSLDSVLYFLLAIYFDKVLPGKYGVPHPPAFFLRPSYWLRGSSGSVGVRTGSSHDPVLGGDAEPMPPGFEGKEAIRLHNIKKIYKKNNKSIEALKGLSLNIYEGQITALLGHSGSGKTALLNVLSGFSKPSAGSAMIYNYNASEVWSMEGMQEKVGVCPQINLHFEALTVKENLRIFSHIKGIQWKEVDEEVLLLDEPTAGLDPCSRHHVWSLLRERRAGRVTLVATQSMEEADIQADRKAFLSCGRLQSVGSSLYLKRKWGIGYHLRVHINDLCDPELVSSMVRQYIPDAVPKGQKRDELCFRLPLENTDSFPGEKPASVSLEGSLWVMAFHGEHTGDGDLEEREQNLPWLSKQGILAMNGMMLWRQQVCALFLQLQARSQLRLAGLFPSAYWCGQALVDIPLFWSLMSLMFGLLVLFTRICPLETRAVLTLVRFGFREFICNGLLWAGCHVSTGTSWSLMSLSLSSSFASLPYIHSVIFAFLLRCLEMRYGEAVPGFDPIFRWVPCEPQLFQSAGWARSCTASRHHVINIINSCCIFVPGEVLGLLGPNGAGKSTTLNMISGGVAVTAGEVLLRSQDGAPSCPGSLGWCPQQNPLWPHLTVLQHLEAFTAIRGMREEDAALAICWNLDLLKHFKTPARSLSAGEARKLSFAMSILGGPAVMLWDEPSMSVDPKGQRMLEASMRSRERAAILCTQSLPEAAAICDRVAVLACGRLRYIGSLEDLKRKFGTSYHLELKMTNAGQSDALHTEILNLFPQAARQERSAPSVQTFFNLALPHQTTVPPNPVPFSWHILISPPLNIIQFI